MHAFRTYSTRVSLLVRMRLRVKHLIPWVWWVLYLQIHDTAMETCMAPSYANLFLEMLKQVHADPGQNTCTCTSSALVVYVYTCVDDIFTIRTHGEPSSWVFIQNFHCHHPTINFTASWWAEQVTFLNTKVYLRDGLIATDLHVKPRDTHRYLQIDTCLFSTPNHAIHTQEMCVPNFLQIWKWGTEPPYIGSTWLYCTAYMYVQ